MNTDILLPASNDDKHGYEFKTENGRFKTLTGLPQDSLRTAFSENTAKEYPGNAFQTFPSPCLPTITTFAAGGKGLSVLGNVKPDAPGCPPPPKRLAISETST